MAKMSTDLFERFEQEMRLRNYAKQTIKAYKSCLRAWVRFIHPKRPREATREEIQAFLLHSLDTGLSRAYLDQSISASRLADRRRGFAHRP